MDNTELLSLQSSLKAIKIVSAQALALLFAASGNAEYLHNECKEQAIKDCGDNLIAKNEIESIYLLI